MNRRDDLAVVGLAEVPRFITGAQNTAGLANSSAFMAQLAAVTAGQLAPGGRVLSSSVGKTRGYAQPDRGTAVSRNRTGANPCPGAGSTRKMEKLGAAPNRLSQRSTRLPRRILECAPTRCRRRHTTASLRAFSRWAAEPHPLARTSLYERSTGLSTAGWVKPCWRDTPGLPPVRSSAFPTTPSIASDLHQAAVLDRINEPESCSIPKQRRVAVTAMVGDTWLRAVESSVPSLRWYPARTLTEWLTRGADLWGASHGTERTARLLPQRAGHLARKGVSPTGKCWASATPRAGRDPPMITDQSGCLCLPDDAGGVAGVRPLGNTPQLIQLSGDDSASAARQWAYAIRSTALGAKRLDTAGRRRATAGSGVVLTGRW